MYLPTQIAVKSSELETIFGYINKNKKQPEEIPTFCKNVMNYNNCIYLNILITNF